jgi:hypothetical protein
VVVEGNKKVGVSLLLCVYFCLNNAHVTIGEGDHWQGKRQGQA